jgi:NAD(P)-dependent dehydrogenase (short-subunit alcohol dehydrogenase family)
MKADLSGRPLSDLIRLDGRTVVVTGGARGIGLAICRRMSEAGATVAVLDVDGAEAESAAQLLRDAFAGKHFALRADVTDSDQVESCADEVLEATGRLDVWVNNAGVFPRLDPVTASTVDVERVLRINVLGVQFGMAAAVSRMRAAGHGGVVVNIASTAGFRGAGMYSASKWAVRGLTQGLAPEVGPDGIRVVALAPTVARTPGMAAWLADADGAGDVAARTAAKVPLGRMCEPDDVARTAVFVASDAAAFITGATIPVDGGSLAVIP